MHLLQHKCSYNAIEFFGGAAKPGSKKWLQFAHRQLVQDMFPEESGPGLLHQCAPFRPQKLPRVEKWLGFVVFGMNHGKIPITV